MKNSDPYHRLIIGAPQEIHSDMTISRRVEKGKIYFKILRSMKELEITKDEAKWLITALKVVMEAP